MGEISLNNFFDTFATGHVFHDQTAADLITATGQVRTVTGTVNTSAKPFRVTLAWTDTPGPTSANAYVNNLDLQVVVGGNTYRGNVFSAVAGNGFSITGGSADPRNNVESVFLPAGVTGPFTITVTGTNIAGNGVPGNALALYHVSPGCPQRPRIVSHPDSFTDSITNAHPNSNAIARTHSFAIANPASGSRCVG